jgi:hypothetical protein
LFLNTDKEEAFIIRGYITSTIIKEMKARRVSWASHATRAGKEEKCPP